MMARRPARKGLSGKVACVLAAATMSIAASCLPAGSDTAALKGFDATPTGLTPVYPSDMTCPPLTSLYGSWIDVDGSRRDEAHGGVDGGDLGDAILAPGDGVIVALWQTNHGWGDEWNVLIAHTPQDLNIADEGFVYFSEFDHLSGDDIAHLARNQRVTRGQKLAHVRRPGGNPAYLPEVHWEVYEVPRNAQGDMTWQRNPFGGEIWWNPSARLIDPLFMMARHDPPGEDGGVTIHPYVPDHDVTSFKGFTYLFVCQAT